MYQDPNMTYGGSIEHRDLVWLAERYGMNMWESKFSDESAAEIFYWWTIHFHLKDLIIWDQVLMHNGNLTFSATSPIVHEFVSMTIFRPSRGEPRRVPGHRLPKQWDHLIDKPYNLGDFEVPAYRANRKSPPLKYHLRKLFGG